MNVSSDIVHLAELESHRGGGKGGNVKRAIRDRVKDCQSTPANRSSPRRPCVITADVTFGPIAVTKTPRCAATASIDSCIDGVVIRSLTHVTGPFPPPPDTVRLDLARWTMSTRHHQRREGRGRQRLAQLPPVRRPSGDAELGRGQCARRQSSITGGPGGLWSITRDRPASHGSSEGAPHVVEDLALLNWEDEPRTVVAELAGVGELGGQPLCRLRPSGQSGR